MKHLLFTTIAAVVLVGCGPSEADRALSDAAESGDIKAAEEAIAAGADIRTGDPNQYGDSPLHKAAKSGHTELVLLLIENGADVNAKDKWGVTPLHWAARKGRKEIAELLINKGADMNAKGYYGTPLHLTTSKEIAELLIAKGADVNAKDKKGKTPLDEAVGEIADLLRKHGGKTREELKAEGK